MRERVAPELAEVYPQFAQKVFGTRHGEVMPRSAAASSAR
jgi:hypothetical protein